MWSAPTCRRFSSGRLVGHGVATSGGQGKDVSCLAIPDGCVGLSTLAALEQGIPVFAVRENKNCMRNRLEDLPFSPGKLFIVENYLEAVGVMTALKAGVAVDTVRRPLAGTTVQSHRSSSHDCSQVSTEARSLRV